MQLLLAAFILFEALLMSSCASQGPNLTRASRPSTTSSLQIASSQPASVAESTTSSVNQQASNPTPTNQTAAVAEADPRQSGTSVGTTTPALVETDRNDVEAAEPAKGLPPSSPHEATPREAPNTGSERTVDRQAQNPTTDSAPSQADTGGVPAVVSALGLLLLLILIVFIVRYSRSDSARARRRLHSYLTQFENALNGQKAILLAMQSALADAAHTYVTEVRRSYLRAIPLDNVRKLAPGVRLQPLYARGLNTLLDCQGLSAANLLQIHGIGPDSASRISAACKALTEIANEQPIRRPGVADGAVSAKQLYTRIYILRRVQALLDGQGKALGETLQELQPKHNSIRSRTSFMRWLFGSETQGTLKEAIEEAKTVETQMLPDRDWGRVLAHGMSRLTEATATGKINTRYDDVVADAAANDTFYKATLENLLGREPDQSSSQDPSATGPPRLTSAPASRPVTIRISAGSPSRYSILGDEPTQTAAKCWVPASIETKIGGFTIRGGLIYVGRNLRSVKQYMVEPALIDPSLETQPSTADCHVRMLSYWSSYTLATPMARASYLQWLERGRNDPAADIGYVFLYFYGLERRTLADAVGDSAAKTEIPTILDEVRRLRSIYTANRSFATYSADFLEFVETTRTIEQGFTEAEESPPLEKSRLSFDLRRRLGSLARSGKPLPANLAYAWFHNDLRTRFPVAAEQCPQQMTALFHTEYGRRFGAGLVLPANKTQLKLTYQPASASFGTPFSKPVDLPDVSVLSTTYAKLQSVGSDCFRQIDGYSRFIARHEGQEQSFEALVLLPATLWPDPIKQALCALKEKATERQDAIVFNLGELLRLFPDAASLTKSKYTNLCAALGVLGVGIEPDVRFGGTVPSPDDPVAVFPSDMTEQTTDGFGITALLLQLASFVAGTDGEFSGEEVQKLREHICTQTGLTLPEQQRLVARMATYRTKPPSASSLKRAIEGIDPRTRTAIVDHLLTILHADGVVSPAEVKALEVIYTLIGIDAATLYTKLHTLAVHDEMADPTAARKNGVIQLNTAKIEQLKAVSAAVTDKLNIIFSSDTEPDAGPAAKQEPPEQPAEGSPSTLLGLDVAHADLLTVLLGRPHWTRAEFEELCTDKGLMPDGAIERINETAFEKFNQPIIDGEDPLEICSQLLLDEKIA